MVRPLSQVRRATGRRTRAEQEWRQAIQQARSSGETLRAIGEAAGVSHVRVIQLLREQH